MKRKMILSLTMISTILCSSIASANTAFKSPIGGNVAQGEIPRLHNDYGKKDNVYESKISPGATGGFEIVSLRSYPISESKMMNESKKKILTNTSRTATKVYLVEGKAGTNFRIDSDHYFEFCNVDVVQKDVLIYSWYKNLENLVLGYHMRQQT